jgi:hypothetical protein
VTPFDDAQQHLSKAREFLEAAEVNRELKLFNAATSALKPAASQLRRRNTATSLMSRSPIPASTASATSWRLASA